MKEYENLSLRQKKYLWCIVQSGGKCPDSGHPQADSSQIRGVWRDTYDEDIPSSSLNRLHDGMSDAGLVDMDKRDEEYHDGPGIPPRVATLTDDGDDMVCDGDLAEAIAMDPDAISDPREFADLRSQVGGLKAEVQRLKTHVDERIEESQEESRGWYTKLSGVLDGIRDDHETLMDEVKKLRSSVTMLDSRSESNQDAISSLDSDVEEIEEYAETMAEWSQDATNRLDEIEERLDAVEARTDRRDERLDHIESWLDDQYDGGFRGRTYDSFEG